MHPLLHLIATRPHLLLDHAQAYSDLLASELPLASSAWKRQALYKTLALMALFLALMLAGVGLMLWAALPAGPMPAPWLLLVVPLLPLALALVCFLAARAGVEHKPFDSLQLQVRADLAMLQAVAASP